MSGPISRARQAAIRRRAMKRLLRVSGVRITPHARYNESALRKLVRGVINTMALKE